MALVKEVMAWGERGIRRHPCSLFVRVRLGVPFLFPSGFMALFCGEVSAHARWC